MDGVIAKVLAEWGVPGILIAYLLYVIRELRGENRRLLDLLLERDTEQDVRNAKIVSDVTSAAIRQSEALESMARRIPAKEAE